MLMSSMATSSSNFQSILDAALDNYHKHTGIDLTKHPSATQLQNCHSPDDVVQLLLERETSFKDYREKYRKFIDRLRPVVKVIHALSGILGERAGPVSDQHWTLLIRPYVYRSLQVPFQPTKVIFTGIDILVSVRIILQRSTIMRLFDIESYQTAISVSASYDALGDLFECVANILRRLHIYTERIPSSPAMSDIMVKIMIEVLNVVALATEQMKTGRFSESSTTHRLSLADRGIEKFAKRLLGESDVEAILQRLDRLTLEEARMTGAHTLQVVHGLFKVVMDGGIPYFVDYPRINKTRLSRRQGIINYYTTSSRYV